MIGSWRIVAGFGAFGAILTLLFSYSDNPAGTTLIRCVYAFLAFTAIAFVLSLVLGVLLKPAGIETPPITGQQEGLAEERGAMLDLVTPDEGGELTELMKERWVDGKGEPPAFQPLAPKRVVSLDNPNPEEVVQAIRRLTDE